MTTITIDLDEIRHALNGEEVIHFDPHTDTFAAWAGGESVTIRLYDITTFKNFDVTLMEQLPDDTRRSRAEVLESMRQHFKRNREENDSDEKPDTAY